MKKSYSWEFGSAKKHIDKSCFASNGTGIPKVFRSFFGVEELGYQESIPIALVFEGCRYRAKIENPKTPEGRRKTRLVWKHNFTDILRSKFPDWEKHFQRDKNYSPERRPQIVFESTEDDFAFKISFISVSVL